MHMYLDMEQPVPTIPKVTSFKIHQPVTFPIHSLLQPVVDWSNPKKKCFTLPKHFAQQNPNGKGFPKVCILCLNKILTVPVGYTGV